jgi:hypothetical protein
VSTSLHTFVGLVTVMHICPRFYETFTSSPCVEACTRNEEVALDSCVIARSTTSPKPAK